MADKKKTVLLAVLGLSPQVLTETLYALHQEGERIDAIHVITTRPGKEAVNAVLLSPADGRYFSYLREYGLDPGSIAFSHHYLHCVRNDLGREIEDILYEEDNEDVMRACLELTFALTQDNDTRLIFSIAGGRKTMTACLMVAASMYARPHDRICHVLVTPEFENHPDFFYIPKISAPITLKDKHGRPYVRETRYAEIRLVDIPFLTVRRLLAPALLNEPLDPKELMRLLIHRKTEDLVVDLPGGGLTWRGVNVPISPARLALYAFFALRKRDEGCAVPTCRGCDDCYLDFQGVSDNQDVITDLYNRITEGCRDLMAMSDTGIMGLTAENFHAYKGKIRRDLLDGFGTVAARRLVIEGKGRRPDTRYGLPLDRAKIRVVW